jgi:hypothetical protein
MHAVRAALSAGIPVWTTFPDEDLRIAREDPGQLKETQRGTWRLVLEGALRVSTPRMLLKSIESLPMCPFGTRASETHESDNSTA